MVRKLASDPAKLLCYCVWLCIFFLYSLAAALPVLCLNSAQYLQTYNADPIWAMTSLGKCLHGPKHLGIIIKVYLII